VRKSSAPTLLLFMPVAGRSDRAHGLNPDSVCACCNRSAAAAAC
jgi:hypothetical protein